MRATRPAADSSTPPRARVVGVLPANDTLAYAVVVRTIPRLPEQFRDLMELNLIALVRCTRAALPHLLARQGHVVNIGSLAAKSASRWVGAYPATKHAVAAYSQQLRLELGPQGLHVLLVCPGPIAREGSRLYPLEGLEDVPERARHPGAGVRASAIAPEWLAKAILRACQRRRRARGRGPPRRRSAPG